MSDKQTRKASADREAHLDNIEITHHTELPATRVSEVLDAFVGGLGRVFSWLWLPVIGVILYTVIARYVFSQGSILLEELAWHISSVAWTVGIAYTLVTDDHVRVDVLHERFELRIQAWLELVCLVLLLLPFLALGIWYGFPYFWDSYVVDEASSAPSGLPNRWFLKFFIPLSLVLTVVAAVSRLLKCTALLFGWPRPIPVSRPAGDAGSAT